MFKRFIYFAIVISPIFFLFSCNDEDFSSNSKYQLELSTDTLSFDSVFSEIPSSTRRIVIKNNNKYSLRISSLFLEKGASSAFNINVSGKASSSNYFTDIEILAEDSMYIFVNVRTETNNSNSPILITDNIKLVYNNNTANIHLETLGQDVIILRDKTILGDTTLTNEKPFLIYGDITNAAGKTLTIEEGCTMYFHKGAGIIVNGNLQAIGSKIKPITLRGDRLDEIYEGTPYDSLPGQWKGINFTSASGIHTLNYLTVKNAINGLAVNNPDNNQYPDFTITNCTLHSSDSCAIVAMNAKMLIANTQITNSGYYNLDIYGGNIDLIHCTIANYVDNMDSPTSSVRLSNYHVANDAAIAHPVICVAKNSIFVGKRSKEIELNKTYKGTEVLSNFDILFNTCLISGTQDMSANFSNIVWTTTPNTVFKNPLNYPTDFSLQNATNAINAGNLSLLGIYTTDKNGNSRISDTAPDLGAYEFQ